jgi:short-subunit dehydrogenase
MKVIGRRLAVVTGAVTDHGLELARRCARQGFDLIIADDEPLIHDAARELGLMGVACRAVQCDLASTSGFASLMAVIASGERPVDFLLANAGHGVGQDLPDQDLDEAIRAIQTNLDGMLRLIFAVAAGMRARGQGRILITASNTGLMPGNFQALYNGSKAFLDSFSMALSNELQGTGVTVTCLLPGATETELFDRATGARMGLATLAPLSQLASPANANRH